MTEGQDIEAREISPPPRHPAATRWLTPSARGGLQLAVQVILSVALFALFQVLATRHNVRFDLTPDQTFVLSEQAVQVARAVERPVRITIFYNSQESGQRREVADLLDQFRSASRQISYRLLDLDRSPGLAQKYGVARYNTGVAESGEQVLALDTVSEEEIANALLKLASDRTPTVCFLTGHGEHTPESADDREGYSEVAKSLEKENFLIRTLSTVPAGGIPAACAVTVVAGPTHDLLPGEADQLHTYLRNGGKLLILADPVAPASIGEFVNRYGIQLGNDLVVDERNRFFGADSFTPQVPMFDQATYGTKLGAAAVFPLARTVLPRDENPPEGVTVSMLALSSPDSWAMVGAPESPESQAQFREEVDRRGPLPMGAIATLEQSAATAPPPGQLVVFGDSDFGTNFYLNLVGNKDLFMSTIAVLAEEPQLIAVRRKGLPRGAMSPISLTATQGRRVFWVAVILQPAFFLFAGAVVTLARRRHQGGR